MDGVNKADPFYNFDRPSLPDDAARSIQLGRVGMPMGEGGGGGGGSPASGSPIDENQESDHPFAIKVEIASKGLDNDWLTADLTVISGTYQTFGGTAFNANGVAFPDAALEETITKGVNGQYTGYVYLYIPLVVDNTSGVPVSNSASKATAVTGGEIRLRSSPAVVWPQAVKVAGGVATAVLIGSWGVKRVNISGGVPTYELRVQIDQKVTDNIVLGNPSDDDEAATPVPFGEATNDTLYWDDTEKKWAKLDAPDTSGTFVLGVKDGVIQWLETQDC